MEVVARDGRTSIVKITKGDALVLAAAVGYVFSEYDALDTVRLEFGGATEDALERIADELDIVLGRTDSEDADG